MDKKELLETVSALTEQVNKAQLNELEVETDEFRIRLSKHLLMPPMPPMAMPVTSAVPANVPISADVKAEAVIKTESGKVIKSPIIGTFYASAAPGKPAFVSVGSRVEKGTVVCIVESMKLMNEITSEFDGVVEEVCVGDGEAVEFDQPLFRIR